MIHPRRATYRPLLALACSVVALVGRTPFGDSSDDAEDGAPVEQPAATVTIPAARTTPFCQAMIDLADRLENDPPDDVQAAIVETYEAIEADVPDAIRDDFDAVLADLRGEGAPEPDDADDDPGTADTEPATTIDPGPPVTDETGATLPPGDPFFDEGYDPEDTPALRLNAFVDFECRDVANNPGPPPTQPLGEVTTTEG